jgi:hypothetical protein
VESEIKVYGSNQIFEISNKILLGFMNTAYFRINIYTLQVIKQLE